jgi:hypothetical protein
MSCTRVSNGSGGGDRPRRRRENNIKMDLNKIGLGDLIALNKIGLGFSGVDLILLLHSHVFNNAPLDTGVTWLR